MDATILAAIIGAVGTVLAAVITVLATSRRQSLPPHANSASLDAPVPSERQSRADHGTPVATKDYQESRAKEVATKAKVGAKESAPASAKNTGMSFDEVIQAILRLQPGAKLGMTAEQGQYFERAKLLTGYHLQTADPPCYGAAQSNGKTMWVYVGKGGKICCGDKA